LRQRVGCCEQRFFQRARHFVDGLQRRIAQAALRLVEDALEGEVVVGLNDDA
jgi:hypothetical protein